MSPSETQSVASNPHKRRFRYASVACEKCQQRKIRCSGDQPCLRCRNSGSPCIYARKTRFRPGYRAPSKRNDVAAGLNQNAPESQEQGAKENSVSPSNESVGGLPSQSSGISIPGSFDYYVRLAESRLASKGSEPSAASPPNPRATLIGISQLQLFVSRRAGNTDGYALDVFGMDVWTEIFQMYDEEVGLQYPFLDSDLFLRQLRKAKEDVSAKTKQPSNGIRNSQHIEDIAGLVLSLLSYIEDPESVGIATSVVQDIFNATIIRVHTIEVEQHDLQILILTSMIFFLKDREIQAWRCIGTVMRLLQELARHDSDHSIVPDKLYWTVYTLDRRWSFGTGLSFAVPDADITRQPFFPDDDSLSSAYLKQMVSYCGIASEVRKNLLDQPAAMPQSPNKYEEGRDYVLFRVAQWQSNLPTRLRFRGADDKFDASREQRGDYKLRLMLHLRANQMQTIIFRKSATLSSAPMSIDPSTMDSMIHVAQDTVRVMVNLARNTDFYHAQHRTFNHFLETALSSLLLAVGWTGPDHRSHPCLADTVAALDLIQQLSRHSHITQRLHQKVQVIQQVVEGLKSQDLERNRIESAISRPKASKDFNLERHPNHSLSAPEGSQCAPDVRIGDNSGANAGPVPEISPSNTQTGPAQVWRPSSSLETSNYSVPGSYTAPCPSFGPFAQNSPDMAMMNTPPNHFTCPQNASSISDSASQSALGDQMSPEGYFPVYLGDLTEAGFRDLNDILMDYDDFSF